MATKSNKNRYMGKKAKLAEMLVNPDLAATVTQMCETVGVARSTFYKWLSDPEYLSYIQDLVDRFTANVKIESPFAALTTEELRKLAGE